MVDDIIIDIVGSFADGKTTLVRSLTSESTLRHSEEKRRGITIRLGYAHFLLYKCTKCSRFSRSDKCETCASKAELYRRVSIIDSPGHKTLMTIMLSGAALVSGAVLVIAANQKCPQPQTAEHLEALKIIGVKNLVVAQTKVDVVGEEKAKQNYAEIKEFLKANGFDGVRIIPVFSAQNININELIQDIGMFTPTGDETKKDPVMLAVRSFDVNKPGTKIKDLSGGVIGGALKAGKLSIGDDIVIYPGVFVKNTWKPVETKVVNIQSEFSEEKKVTSGLTVGVKTTLDPSLARKDNLAGSLLTSKNNPPLFKNKISITYSPMAEKEKTYFKKPLQKNELVLLNVLASKVLGTVFSVANGKAVILLNNSLLPYYIGDKAILSRKMENVWSLAGSGTILE